MVSRRRNLCLASGVLAMCAWQAWAQDARDYPNRPVRLVVPYAPGGTTDFAARVISTRLSEAMGQSIVVDNRPGAGSIIGTEVVAKANADGYTLLMADTGFSLVPALYAKLITLAFPTMAVALPHVNSGKLRALAVIAPKRSSVLPDVPTMAEAGYPSVTMTSWYGVLAPAKTSKPIIDRLQSELTKLVNMPDVRERFASQSAEVVGGTPTAFAKLIAAEISTWRTVARAGNIKAE